AAGERTGLLLLARPRDASDHSSIGVVHHQIAGGHVRWTRDQIHDLVRASALLRPVARSVAEGTILPGRGTVDREARHGDPRALTHRSRIQRHPPHRAQRRHLFGELPRPALLRRSRRDGAPLSRQQAVARRGRFSARRFQVVAEAPRRRRRRELPAVSIVPAALYGTTGPATTV